MERMWILVGMMGAGKSTLGRELAKISGRDFKDTDTLLQNRFGRPVAQIFEVYGEQTFRGHETSVLAGLEPTHTVLATGGGIVMREENWTELRRLGTTIFLEVPLEDLVRRLTISKKRRPLLEVEGWQDRLRELYEARLPLYQRADITFHVEFDDSSALAKRLLKRLIPE